MHSICALIYVDNAIWIYTVRWLRIPYDNDDDTIYYGDVVGAYLLILLMMRYPYWHIPYDDDDAWYDDALLYTMMNTPWC